MSRMNFFGYVAHATIYSVECSL